MARADGLRPRGWYSYDQLDMLGKSADRIVPDCQALKVGDIMPTSPTSGFAVKVVEPGRALVLYSDTEIVATELDKAKAAEPKGGTEIPPASPPRARSSGRRRRTSPPAGRSSSSRWMAAGPASSSASGSASVRLRRPSAWWLR